MNDDPRNNTLPHPPAFDAWRRFSLLDWLGARPPAMQPFLWFGGLIVVGTALLSLPFARTGQGPDGGPVAELFMSTSAVCVTGLAVAPVGTYYTLFGQATLLVLIELGGLGLMTFASVGFQLFRRRLSLSSQAAVDDALFGYGSAADFRKTFGRMVRVVLSVQALGALWLFAALLPYHWDGERWARAMAAAAWSAAFHAVSAFCNAGLSLYDSSLEMFEARPSVLLPFMVLIVLGGLGHVVLAELWQRLRLSWTVHRSRRRLRGQRSFMLPPRRPMSLHTRVVLWMTLALGVSGGLLLWAMAWHSDGGIGVFDVFFHSIAGKTGGMNSVPVARFGVAGLTLLCALMFIGGSPGSCAGGIKTTSFAIWLGALAGGLRGRPDVTIFGRVIVPELVSKAKILVGCSCLFVLTGTIILCLTEPNARLDGGQRQRVTQAPHTATASASTSQNEAAAGEGEAEDQTARWGLVDLLFEQVSAFGTVGLSTGVTPTLSLPGRLWVVLSMFLGRLGPLSVALWILPAPKARVRGAHGRLMIG